MVHANLISFQIRIGTMPDGNKLGLVAREIDDRDVPRANLVLGQLRARNLPVPAAVFAERLARSAGNDADQRAGSATGSGARRKLNPQHFRLSDSNGAELSPSSRGGYPAR